MTPTLGRMSHRSRSRAPRLTLHAHRDPPPCLRTSSLPGPSASAGLASPSSAPTGSARGRGRQAELGGVTHQVERQAQQVWLVQQVRAGRAAGGHTAWLP